MNKYMKIANDLAAENLITNAGGPFGAVVVRDGEVIGRGANRVLAHHDPTAHAEVMAIRDACRRLGTHDLSGCVVYTTCYPCPMCLSAIIWANIREVYYGNTKEDAADIGFRDDFIYQYLEMLSSEGKGEALTLTAMDREETIDVFRQFAAKEDRQMY